MTKIELAADFTNRANMHRTFAQSSTPAIDAATGRTVPGFDPDEEQRWITLFDSLASSVGAVDAATMERVREVFAAEPFADECWQADVTSLRLGAAPRDAQGFLERFLDRFPATL